MRDPNNSISTANNKKCQKKKKSSDLGSFLESNNNKGRNANDRTSFKSLSVSSKASSSNKSRQQQQQQRQNEIRNRIDMAKRHEEEQQDRQHVDRFNIQSLSSSNHYQQQQQHRPMEYGNNRRNMMKKEFSLSQDDMCLILHNKTNNSRKNGNTCFDDSCISDLGFDESFIVRPSNANKYKQQQQQQNDEIQKRRTGPSDVTRMLNRELSLSRDAIFLETDNNDVNGNGGNGFFDGNISELGFDESFRGSSGGNEVFVQAQQQQQQQQQQPQPPSSSRKIKKKLHVPGLQMIQEINPLNKMNNKGSSNKDISLSSSSKSKKQHHQKEKHNQSSLKSNITIDRNLLKTDETYIDSMFQQKPALQQQQKKKKQGSTRSEKKHDMSAQQCKVYSKDPRMNKDYLDSMFSR